MAEILKRFLMNADIENTPVFKIKALYIVDCGLSDASLAKILEGVLHQSNKYNQEINGKKPLKTTAPFLETFVSHRNDFGKLSVPVLLELLPSLRCIQLSKPGASCSNQEVHALLDGCLESSSLKLHTLNFRFTSLSDARLLARLGQCLEYKP